MVPGRERPKRGRWSPVTKERFSASRYDAGLTRQTLGQVGITGCGEELRFRSVMQAREEPSLSMCGTRFTVWG